MSSPLSMLKKTRRTPLPGTLNEQRGKQKVPFKRNLLQEIQAELISEDPNAPLSSHANITSTSKSHAPKKQGGPPSDFELMAAMMQRVTSLEATVRSQAREIQDKEKHISVLERRLRAQEESGSARRPSSGGDDAERRCQRLQSQVQQMEKFLSDYGLIWVGDDSAESEGTHSSDGDLWQTGPPADRSFCMNFDLVLRRIRELNVLTGEGEAFVQATACGAKLARKDPVQLWLYSNGILMFNGPFRSYQEHSTQQCMQDIMDGYFPSELQDRFPDGVPFEVLVIGFLSACVEIHRRLTRDPLCRFTTADTRDLSSSCRGTHFLAKDGPFVGRRTLSAFGPQVRSALVSDTESAEETVL
uniref:UBX domain-containing protein 11 n=1 Tax=Kryptolebias marmoratus TaxID=37003 RepID=A0A3Q3GYC6_KRYMA